MYPPSATASWESNQAPKVAVYIRRSLQQLDITPEDTTGCHLVMYRADISQNNGDTAIFTSQCHMQDVCQSASADPEARRNRSSQGGDWFAIAT